MPECGFMHMEWPALIFDLTSYSTIPSEDETKWKNGIDFAKYTYEDLQIDLRVPKCP
jgi:hypothetical protein